MKTVWIVAGSLTGLILVLIMGLIVLSALGSSRTRHSYEEEKRVLLDLGRAHPPFPMPAAARTKNLPEPARKYAESQRANGRSSIKSAIIEQAGTIRTGPDQPWMPFTAEQIYSFNPPGFLWLAHARIAPGLSIWVRDKYVGGKGNMRIKLFGLFTLADARGPELDQGAALRYWGEILVFPSAAFGPGVVWRPVDGRRARVSFADAGRTVEGMLEFDEHGDPVEFHANRYQDRGGTSVLLPWTGRFRDWKNMDGLRIPAHWEAVWHQPEGEFVYVRMDILHVRTE